VALNPRGKNHRRVGSVKQSDLRVSIEATFVAPNTDLIQQWLFLAPLVCAGIGVFFALSCTVVNSYSKYKRSKIHFVPEDQAQNENAIGLHDALTTPSRQMPPALPPALESNSNMAILDDLTAQGLLTSDQHAAAANLARANDPRVVGAISCHERNRMRTALLLSKLTTPTTAHD